MDTAAEQRDCPLCGFRHAPIESGLHRVRDRIGSRGAPITIEPRDDRPAWLARSAKDLTGGTPK